MITSPKGHVPYDRLTPVCSLPRQASGVLVHVLSWMPFCIPKQITGQEPMVLCSLSCLSPNKHVPTTDGPLIKAHASIPPDPHYFTSHTVLPQTLLCQLSGCLLEVCWPCSVSPPTIFPLSKQSTCCLKGNASSLGRRTTMAVASQLFGGPVVPGYCTSH